MKRRQLSSGVDVVMRIDHQIKGLVCKETGQAFKVLHDIRLLRVCVPDTKDIMVEDRDPPIGLGIGGSRFLTLWKSVQVW